MEADPTRVVSYFGVFHQAQLDLSAWVEKGISPAATTNYVIQDGQVIVPARAEQRKGIQPSVDAKVNGNKRADIKRGQTVTLTASIEVPKGQGKLVAAAWNMEGISDTTKQDLPSDFENSSFFPLKAKWIRTGTKATLKTTYTFKKPGTYFLTIRIASERRGDNKTPYTRIQNLDRVRVVVN